MALFSPTYNININLPGPGNPDDLAQLKQFMAENFDQLKAKVEAQSAQLDTITTSVETANTSLTGLTDDIAYLKETLANGPTPEQITELTTLVDGMGTKISAASTTLSTLGTTLADLDAQTTRPASPEPEQPQA